MSDFTIINVKRPSNHALILVLRACQDLHVAADALAHFGLEGATLVADAAYRLQILPSRSAAALAAAAVRSVADRYGSNIDPDTESVVTVASDSCIAAFDVLPHH